ncbi:hypothetical protein BH09SUM1_BH09SUM1_17730 [soil metagenome]
MALKDLLGKIKTQINQTRDSFGVGADVEITRGDLEIGVPLPPAEAPAGPPGMELAQPSSGPRTRNSSDGEQSDSPLRQGLIASGAGDQAYRQRSEQVNSIEALFGEFGPSVCSYMLTQSLSSGGIGRVIKKLNLNSRGRDGADMAQIEGWILKNGVEPFCKSVGIRTTAPTPLPMTTPMGPTLGASPSTPGLTVKPLPEASRTPRPSNMTPLPVSGEFPRAPAVAPTHIQRVSVQPTSLKGKDVMRVQTRDAFEDPHLTPNPAAAAPPSVPVPPPMPPPRAVPQPIPQTGGVFPFMPKSGENKTPNPENYTEDDIRRP